MKWLLNTSHLLHLLLSVVQQDRLHKESDLQTFPSKSQQYYYPYIHSDLIVKYNVCLKTHLHQCISDPAYRSAFYQQSEIRTSLFSYRD